MNALPDQALDLSQLSRREREVLDVAMEGLSAREIADRLSVTEATVRSHLSTTYGKLGVSGRVELLARARPGSNEAGGRPDEASAAGSLGRRLTLRRLSLAAYTLWFGAVWGFATYGYTQTDLTTGATDTGMLYVWLAMALAGSILVVLKTLRIPDRALRARVSFADLAVIAVALALVALLPAEIGMVKGVVLLALFVPYAYWYLRTLAERGLA